MLLLNKNNEAEYLRITKAIAKEAGYNPDDLKLAHHANHKLSMNGVMFGHIDYPDFVLFIMNGDVDEGIKRRKNYLSRTANMKGEWKKDKFSRNNLARRIIWFEDK